MAMVETRRTGSGNGDPDSLRERVVAVGTSWSLAQYSLVTLVAALDASREWVGDGAPTCAHWVARALDVEVCTAREWLRIGKALVGLPMIDAAFDDRLLSYSKVRMLTRVATADNELELLELAARIPAGRLGVALAAWLSAREMPEETEARHHKARGLFWRTEPDGMIGGSFRLPPADAKRLTEAIDAEIVRGRRERADASADAWPSIPQQRADALVRLIAGGGARVLTEILLHVRGDGATFDDGTPIPWTVLERIAPESFVRTLIHDAEGRPINASGRHRHPSARQKRVVRERDQRCVDCGGTEFLQFDHEPDFAISGRTVVDELRLRCWICHRARHAEADPPPGRRRT